MEVTIEESTTEKVSPLLHKTVQRILIESQNVDSVQKDLMFVLLVVSMIENGLVAVDDELQVIDFIKTFNMAQLSKWKLPTGTIKAPFLMPGFRNVTLKLIMSPLGATVMVNVILNELNSETYSICLPVSRYVVSPQATSIPMIFRDLKHFSVTFKNKVLTAVKSRILSHHGYPSASLIGLPEEVLTKIILKLPIVDIINVCKTCSRLKTVLENNSLWYALEKRDFGDDQTVLFDDSKDWKAEYKRNHIQLQEVIARSRQGACSMCDVPNINDPTYMFNPLWNVIL